MEMNGRKFGRKDLMVAITATVVVILLILTFVVPDRTGQIRTDIVVGDYIILESDRFLVKYTVEEVKEDILVVEVYSYDLRTHAPTAETSDMTKEMFLELVYYPDEKLKMSEYEGAIFQETPLGSKLCQIYGMYMNTYHVDEYNVIYYSAIGGNFWFLKATSLIYGADENNMPVPNVLRGST